MLVTLSPVGWVEGGCTFVEVKLICWALTRTGGGAGVEVKVTDCVLVRMGEGAGGRVG